MAAGMSDADSRSVDCLESLKNKKYDRQLRLWDNHGQQALESAHVCLINASATGTEILKSLVLPGIGAFTIIDGNPINARDVGNNFFLDKESIGKSRAKVAAEYLLQLNPDVRGDFFEEDFSRLLAEEIKFFEKFSVVIATNINDNNVLILAEKMWKLGIPLLICRSYGMIGYMRLQISEHPVIESHPESEYHDLRLDKPFASLEEYCALFDLENLNDHDHAHVPFVVILLKHLNMWKSQNDGKLPKSGKEKNLFKSQILNSMRKKQDDEENFIEAANAVNRSIVESSIPNEVHEIMNDSQCLNLTSESKPFWILVRALKYFIENEGNGYLPLRGTIPDMTSDTNNYIKLQNIYREKAENDAKIIFKRIQQILSDLGKPQSFISEKDVKLFCKNAHCLRLIKGSYINHENDLQNPKIHNLLANLEHEDSDFIFYVLLRAIGVFYCTHIRLPGELNNDDELEMDVIKLKDCFYSFLKQWGFTSILKDDYVHEMCRFGGCELHSVAAFIGGCAAHEVIKLITGQYVPFNNTLIYNALNQSVSVYCL